jgi:molecular chaperone DnaK
VACADATRVRALRDEDGRLLTPSLVAFPPSGEVKVGYAARELRLRDPAATISSVKRLIGRPYDSEVVSRAASQLPFAIERGPTGGVVVRVRDAVLSLPEVASLIVRRLREIAERALGEPCERAVMTVPASFNELQRSATRDAALIAGMSVLRILNEPTAAALAYGYRARQRQRVAVYDFGGGTFDLSILEMSGEIIEVVSTAGDTNLGGDDLDRAIAALMATRYAEQCSSRVAQGQHGDARLLVAAERLKCRLSKQERAELTIRGLAGEDGVVRDFTCGVERAETEALGAPLLERTFALCAEALRLASLRADQLDAVLLVGGQTRMPWVRARVSAFFGREALCSIDPELAVAQGAALLGYSLGDASQPSGKAGVDDAPTARASRPRFDAEVKLPSLRAEPPRPDLTQTLPGVAADRETEPEAPLRPHAGEMKQAAPRAAERDPRFETLPTRPRALRGSDARPTSPPSAPSPRPSRAPGERPVQLGQVDPAAQVDRAEQLDEHDESELPVVLRSSMPAAAPKPSTTTLLESPRAKSRAKAELSVPPTRSPSGSEARLLEARALAANGHIGEALALYGDLLVRDPNDPRLLREARALRQQQALAAGSVVSAPSVPAVAAPSERAPQPEHKPSTGGLAGRPTGVPESAAADDWLGPLEELIFSAPTLPPELQSAAPEAASQLPGPRGPTPLLLEVTPCSLNVETVEGFCEPVIGRNAPIPAEQTRIFTTSRDQQTTVSVRVSQGEGRRTQDNLVLGHVELLDLPKAPRGGVQIAVTFVIDVDGTLSARAIDLATGRSQELRVRLTGAIDPAELARMRAAGARRAP